MVVGVTKRLGERSTPSNQQYSQHLSKFGRELPGLSAKIGVICGRAMFSAH